ncbi:hypothetical protein O3M35_001854 [Rhynocoris fuscipes]|uniref:GPI inositol-deacylase n=1 Tax=Rhynocoris fuscipes TaxID=488301 RepID=A0AAW1CWH3_9HEMI
MDLGFVFFSFIFVITYMLGCYNFLTNYEENRCNMTYMFEYPKLVRVYLPSNVTNLYKKYGLYAYGEGRYIERVRDMKFTGIPVLFIPGNRGSPKQIRSLASVSLRKSIGSRTPFHFDFFAVDLNEDYSGIFGGFLQDQTQFVDICIKKILSLYRPESSTKSVILIGHSMGGVIAKGLFLEPEFNKDSVKIIITLAAPHSPALLLDSLLADYYERINKYWDNNTDIKQNLNLFSIGGGPRDLLVKSSLTSTPHADINVITTSIRDVWVSVDHLCILWCKEFILVIIRALFDCVDLKTNQISDDVKFRREIFKYHLLERSGSKRYQPSHYPLEVSLWNGNKQTSHWFPMIASNMIWTEPKGVSLPTHISVSLATASDTLAIQTQNHKTKDWIFACVVDNSVSNMRVCKIGTNLSQKAKISPNVGMKRKSAIIDLSKLRMDGYTHVIVRTLPTTEFVQISLDLFKRKQRTIQGNADYFTRSTLFNSVEPGSLYYTVEIPGLQKLWQPHELYIESNCSLPLLAEVTVNIPWSHEGGTYAISGSKGSIPIMVHSSKNTSDSGNVQVELLLNPQCNYNAKLDRHILDLLGAIVGKFGINVGPLIAVCLLLTLAYQLRALEETSSCPLLQVAMPLAAKPYVVIQASAILSAIARPVSMYVPIIPSIDIKNQSGFMELLIIPLFLYMTAFALTFIIGTGVLIAVIFQGQAFHAVLLKFLNRFCFGLSWLSDYVISGANKVPIIVAAFMLTLAHSGCGGLALAVGLCFYFFKMVSLYEDFWEEIIYWPLRVLKAKLKEYKEKKKMEMPKLELPPIKDISFHLTLMLLWAIVVVINIPTILVWAKQTRYSTKLHPDPGFLPSIIMSLCAAILWQTDTPKTGLILSKPLSYVMFLLAVIIMVFGQTSIYRISYIISMAFVLVTLHQLIAPWFTPEEECPELVEGRAELMQFESIISEVLERYAQKMEKSEELTELHSKNDEEQKAIEDDENENEEEEVEEDDEEEEDEEDDDDEGEEKDNEEQIDETKSPSDKQCIKGEDTPSSDASSSSFEQISEKDIT